MSHSQGPDAAKPVDRRVPFDFSGTANDRERAQLGNSSSLDPSAGVVEINDDDGKNDESSSSSSLIDKMREAGMTLSSALVCAKDFRPERIQRQLDALPARIERLRRKGEIVRDAGGLLFKAIIGDWSLPKPPPVQIREWQVAHAEKNLLHVTHVSPEERLEQRKQFEGAALEYLQGLPDDERETIQHDAENLVRKLYGTQRLKHAPFVLLGRIQKHAAAHGVTL